MRQLIIIGIALIYTTMSFAQMGFGKVKDIEAVENRKLIILLESPREEAVYVKKKKDNFVEEMAAYKSYVEAYNQMLQEVVPQHWQVDNKGIVFKTRKQIESLKKRGDKKYAVLYVAHKRTSNFSSRTYANHNMLWAGSKGNEARKHASIYSELRICLIEKYGKDAPIYLTKLANPMPEACDIAYGAGTIKEYFELRKSGTKVKLKDLKAKWQISKQELKNKTLLLREDWMAEDFDAEKAAKAYSYPIEVVSANVFNEKISQRAEGYAYAIIVPMVINSKAPTAIASSQSVFYHHAIINAADGQLLNMVGQRPIMVGPISFSKGEGVGKFYDEAISTYQ